MSYNYQTEKAKIFTDEGQRDFLKIRNKVNELLETAGAFAMFRALCISGNTWFMMACVDRMVELGEIKEVTGSDVRGQDRVFVAAGCK